MTNNDSSLLSLALRALRNSSAVVFQDVAQAGLREEAIAALSAAVEAGASVLPGAHVAVPVNLDEGFAKAVAVVHTLDDDDWSFADEAWGFIVKEALDRQALREAGKDPVRVAAQRVVQLPFDTLTDEQNQALNALAETLGVPIELPG